MKETGPQLQMHVPMSTCLKTHSNPSADTEEAVSWLFVRFLGNMEDLIYLLSAERLRTFALQEED
jgi:hypothetical protein